MITAGTYIISWPFHWVQDIEIKDMMVCLSAQITKGGSLERKLLEKNWSGKRGISKTHKRMKRPQIKIETKEEPASDPRFPGGNIWIMVPTVNASCRRKIEGFEMVCYKEICIRNTLDRMKNERFRFPTTKHIQPLKFIDAYLNFLAMSCGKTA